MGGLKKYMPKTFWTFIICSIALAGIFPLSGFWSKDEILAGTGGFGLFGGTGGNGTYYAMLLMGLLTAMLTAAYMTRCIYLVFFGEYRGHGTPHESGPRITTPLIILAGVRDRRRLREPAREPVRVHPRRMGIALRALRRTQGRVLPGDRPRAQPVTRWRSCRCVVVGCDCDRGLLLLRPRRSQGPAAGSKKLTELPDGPTTKFAPARAGYTFLVNKYYLDYLYNNVIVYAFKKPFANAAYWFNQKVLDGIVDRAGKGSVAAGRAVYKYIDQGLVDGIVNGSGVASDEAGQGLRKMQTGKVQQYAAFMFAAVAILAGILMIVAQ